MTQEEDMGDSEGVTSEGVYISLYLFISNRHRLSVSHSTACQRPSHSSDPISCLLQSLTGSWQKGQEQQIVFLQ